MQTEENLQISSSLAIPNKKITLQRHSPWNGFYWKPPGSTESLKCLLKSKPNLNTLLHYNVYHWLHPHFTTASECSKPHPGSQPIKLILWKLPRKTALSRGKWKKKNKRTEILICTFINSVYHVPGNSLERCTFNFNINNTLCGSLALLLMFPLLHLIITKWYVGFHVK